MTNSLVGGIILDEVNKRLEAGQGRYGTSGGINDQITKQLASGLTLSGDELFEVLMRVAKEAGNSHKVAYEDRLGRIVAELEDIVIDTDSLKLYRRFGRLKGELEMLKSTNRSSHV